MENPNTWNKVEKAIDAAIAIANEYDLHQALFIVMALSTKGYLIQDKDREAEAIIKLALQEHKESISPGVTRGSDVRRIYQKLVENKLIMEGIND